MKQCRICNTTLLEGINITSATLKVNDYRCKTCRNEYTKSWKKQNHVNLERYKCYNTKYNSEYKPIIKDKELKRNKHKIWYQNKYINDPIFKQQCVIRSLIYSSFNRSLKGIYKKGKKTESILGCTIEEFIQHLQSLFTEGMTLENHGQGKGKWNIDHIVPISSAKTEEEIYKLNHHSNLQPLWWEENMAKGAKKE
jgi:hypothetical protein